MSIRHVWLNLLLLTGSASLLCFAVACEKEEIVLRPSLECLEELDLFDVNGVINANLIPQSSCIGSCLTFVPRSALRILSGESSILSSESDRIFALNGERLRVEETGGPHLKAGLLFRYFGISDETRPLASGTVISQITLRMFLDDPCNLVNINWRFLPEEELIVSLKTNQGMTTSPECGADGYTFFNETVLPVNFPPQGSTSTTDSMYHSLFATIEQFPDPSNSSNTLRELVVCADGNEVYRAIAPGMTLSFDHRAGLRMDNGKFEVGFLTR